VAQSKQRNRDDQDEDRPNPSTDKGDEEPEFVEKPKKRVKLGTFADIWPKVSR